MAIDYWQLDVRWVYDLTSSKHDTASDLKLAYDKLYLGNLYWQRREKSTKRDKDGLDWFMA